MQFDVETSRITYANFAAKRGIQLDQKRLFPAFLKHYDRLSVETSCFGHNSCGPRSWWIQLVSHSIADSMEGTSNSGICEEIGSDLYDFYNTKEAWQLIEPNIGEILQKLSKSGLRLGVISNFDGRLHSLLRQFDLSKHFDSIVLSGEFGREKPAPELFKLTAEQCGLKGTSELLHIGNDLDKDYKGAISAGAQALLFDPQNKHPNIPDQEKLVKICDLERILL
ncbi:hypothetical protein WR25_10231 [Diploscapter pachys]|uniref:Haloacid dehalogenase-like hydrolase domain-containing protein 3 n=1 Tax=Diploscapter pachys TaxID=2018661 RepID=A0A2A2KD36_9BILA|nr:hypothetical protein WR25_10231 [Diploscapter pachys]